MLPSAWSRKTTTPNVDKSEERGRVYQMIIFLVQGFLGLVQYTPKALSPGSFFFFIIRQFYGRRALLGCIILTPARIITTLRPSFTTKSNPISDALRTQKTKCPEVGSNPGPLQMPDSKPATVTIKLLCSLDPDL